jgi:hypothetical protein
MVSSKIYHFRLFLRCRLRIYTYFQCCGLLFESLCDTQSVIFDLFFFYKILKLLPNPPPAEINSGFFLKSTFDV